MASYRGHLMFSSGLAAGYAGVAMLQWHLPWGPAALGAGLATLGGLLPDLDSDSGVPVRELFGIMAAVVPLLLLQRLGRPDEETIVYLAAIYLFIRYGVSHVFKRLTVHRGMFHSIPALLIAGLSTYLLAPQFGQTVRLFLAGGVMLGFLSHLVLDELYSVDFMGSRLHLSKYAGSALKFASPSRRATLLTYALLGVLSYLAYLDWPR
jgi:hypothetical protein